MNPRFNDQMEAEAHARADAGDPMPLREEISRQMIRMAHAASEQGDQKVCDALMIAGAAIGLGELDDIKRLVQFPSMSEATAKLPFKSITELEANYTAFVKQSQTRQFRFNLWLPSLKLRPLVPGELAVVLSDTGVGKSCFLANWARMAAPLTTLFFQLELPGTMMFERYVQMQCRMTGDEVFDYYREDNPPNYRHEELSHIWTCDRSGITPQQIEQWIIKSQDLTGTPPAIVVVDYIGLVQGAGKRYERVSDAAEQLKVVAKNTNVILIMASQVARPEDREELVEPRLHHARDSGAIENSAGLVLGLWRDPADKELLHIKVLKSSKAAAGTVINCRFDTRTMTITELAKATPDWRDK